MEAAEYQGWRFPVACLVWVPDFQDRHLPQLFSARSLYGKSLGLRLQLATKRTVLVSSEDARGDCERFYPQSRGKTAVARFAVRPALQPGESDPRVSAIHGLPARYFYLPNQYWVHKNHIRVVDALRILRDRGTITTRDGGPPVLVTVHPSSILRAPDDAGRKEAFRAFVADLRAAAKALGRR